jgi:TPR repeat protein
MFFVFIGFFTPNEALSKPFIGDHTSIDQVYENGRLLRAQFKNREAREYLKYSMKKGSAKGFYLYAIELKGYNQTVRTDSNVYDYISRAAELGDKQAVRYLALGELSEDVSFFWKDKYFELLNQLVNEDKGQAFFEFYLFYQHSDLELAKDYLKKSVALMHPVALMVQGDLIMQGGGPYWFSFTRKKASIEIYKQAAKTYYLPAIKKFINILDEIGDEDQAFEWLLKAAGLGDLSSIALVARTLSGKRGVHKYAPLSLSQAKAYYDIYINIAGQDKFSALYTSMLAEQYELVNKMSDEQLKEADQNLIKIKENVKYFYSSDIFWFDDGYLYSL